MCKIIKKHRKHSNQLNVPKKISWQVPQYITTRDYNPDHKTMMVNLTVDENETVREDLSCNTRLFGVDQNILFSAFNVPLSIVAFLGNVLIIFAF